MPAAASSGISRFVAIAARTASSLPDAHSSASAIAAEKSATSSGSSSRSCLRGDVGQHGQPGDRRLVRVHDEVAAAARRSSHERVGHPRGVHVAGLELGRHVGEGDLDELDRRGVAAVVLHGLQMVRSPAAPRLLTETFLPARSAGPRDAGVAERDDGVHVVALGEAVGVVADDDDAEVLLVGADRAERLADRELDVAAEQGGDGLAPPCAGTTSTSRPWSSKIPSSIAPQRAPVSAIGSAATRTRRELRRRRRRRSGAVVGAAAGIGAAAEGEGCGGQHARWRQDSSSLTSLSGHCGQGVIEAVRRRELVGDSCERSGRHRVVLTVPSSSRTHSNVKLFVTPVMKELNN